MYRSGRRKWCCSFAVPPSSPEKPPIITKVHRKKTDAVTSSPQSSKSGTKFDPRRILSPGRVSPIDSEPTVREIVPPPEPRLESVCGGGGGGGGREGEGRELDVRLNLRGRNGGGLVLQMSSDVLIEKSEVFAGLICDYRNSLGSKSDNSNSAAKVCRIEVADVENLGVFRETIELMFEEDIANILVKMGVYKAIHILEVSAGIMFKKGVMSCLKYIEAVPWTEEEEEKLRDLFTAFKFDQSTTRDIRARLYLLDPVDSEQNLARKLVWSITNCSDANTRNELKLLVKGLLCKSSVYEKDQHDIDKEDLYDVCYACLDSIVKLLEEATETAPYGKVVKKTGKSLIERISTQVDNINWLLEILVDRQMAEEFVDIWADQQELVKMHHSASPMVRYELSRVSGILFIAMGSRKLQCRSEARVALLQAWFGPMLMDFGWLQRCKKGLDIKALEEAMGQTLLTLPLRQQYVLFMEWFRCFSKHGNECPNLSKAFQIWWRRSFLRGSDTNAIESRCRRMEPNARTRQLPLASPGYINATYSKHISIDTVFVPRMVQRTKTNGMGSFGTFSASVIWAGQNTLNLKPSAESLIE